MPVSDGAAPKSRPRKKTADARKAEADGFLDIEQCGVTLRIPLGENVPLAAYMAFKANGGNNLDDEMRGTELLLGAEQWQAFMDANPTVGDFAEIGKKLAEVLGN